MRMVSLDMVVEIFIGPYFILEGRKTHQVKVTALAERGAPWKYLCSPRRP